MSKKKRIQDETRTFRKKWSENFFFFQHEEKIMGLICKHKVAVINGYRLMLPYENHAIYHSLGEH